MLLKLSPNKLPSRSDGLEKSVISGSVEGGFDYRVSMYWNPAMTSRKELSVAVLKSAGFKNPSGTSRKPAAKADAKAGLPSGVISYDSRKMPIGARLQRARTLLAASQHMVEAFGLDEIHVDGHSLSAVTGVDMAVINLGLSSDRQVPVGGLILRDGPGVCATHETTAWDLSRAVVVEGAAVLRHPVRFGRFMIDELNEARRHPSVPFFSELVDFQEYRYLQGINLEAEIAILSESLPISRIRRTADFVVRSCPSPDVMTVEGTHLSEIYAPLSAQAFVNLHPRALSPTG